MSRNPSDSTLFLVGAAASLALSLLAFYLQKDNGPKIEKMDCFEKLPAELKFLVFEQCYSLRDVASLSAASPSVRACYRANRDKLLGYHISYIREIFYNDELIPLALMVARMRHRLKKGYRMHQLMGLLEDYVRGGRSKLFRRKFDHWEENLAQIQDLVNTSTEIMEICPRKDYDPSAVFHRPVLSKLWHHRLVETYLREEISTTMKLYGDSIMFPPQESLSSELYVFLFTNNYVGSRLPDAYTADMVDIQTAVCRLGDRVFQACQDTGCTTGDPLQRLRMSERRRHEIQSWREERKKAWKEEDQMAQNGQAVVYNGYGRLLRDDEPAQTNQI
ncbi:hypothetical protein FCIRC_13494 [Fusarium circinatum]|uniref:F-box domain-containing protein n=1 Tax=Fusarium circinatum TaxID=48490 RepID=A0A8H5WFS5_FUSCI|nr:hypothetical protein FCIRC_13494 [Fusarium circinatum]